jgi:chemotaxis signal transduction protein
VSSPEVLLTFWVGNLACACTLAAVQRVLPVTALATTEEATAAGLLGTVTLAEAPVPVVDARRLLGVEGEAPAQVIVLSQLPLGVAVRQVADPADCDSACAHPLPDWLARHCASRGIAHIAQLAEPRLVVDSTGNAWRQRSGSSATP